MGDAMDDAESELTGKAAVQALLIDRLDAAGLARPKRIAREAWDAGRRHLCERLAYMVPENLRTLAEALIDTAPGSEWPSEMVVMNLARGIQAPPPAQSRALTSWLASVEGPRAVAGGYLVDLYRFIRQRLRPPSQFEMREISDRARDHARRGQIIREKITAGVVTDDERQWLDAWLRDEALALALVDEGNRKREGAAA